MTNGSLERITTGDGSETLTRAGVSYRSIDGARTESQHVYVAPTQKSGDRRILELGFGGATNFCEALASMPPGAHLTYFAIEHDPVDPSWVVGEGPGRGFAMAALDQLQRASIAQIESPSLRLVVLNSPWQDADFGEDLCVDAIFHDPFSVSENPDCWTKACFSWELEQASPNARLVTYGAASAIRRAMVDAGWEVAMRPGIGRKREVTMAARSLAALDGLKILSEKYR